MKVSENFSRYEFECRCGCGFAAAVAIINLYFIYKPSK